MSAIDYLEELKKSNTGAYAQKWLDEAIEALKWKEAFDDRKIWITISRGLYDKAMSALDRESIIDDIRVEISDWEYGLDLINISKEEKEITRKTLKEVLKTIDRYIKTESEDETNK